MGRPKKELRGERFGRLLVTEDGGRTKDGKMRWVCVCDCGNVVTVAASDLCKPGRGTKSCGCLAREKASARLRTHGMSRHPAFAVWRSMLARCLNPNHFAFKNYGARGIRVCQQWQESFENFWANMGPTYERGLTLDRTDNDGDYTPSNCRWVDWRTQGMNRRAARFVCYGEARVNVAEASRRSGIKVNTILYRLDHGWPEEELFRQPDSHNRVEVK